MHYSMAYSIAAILDAAQSTINIIDVHTGILQNGILGLILCAIVIYTRETKKSRAETAEQAKLSRELNNIVFVDRFISAFFNEDSRILIMLFKNDLLKFNTKSLTSKQGIPHGHTRYSASDINLKWFKKEHTNKYILVNEIFAKYGIKEGGYDSVTAEQLTEAFNELIVIPDLLQSIIENKEPSSMQAGAVVNTRDVLKNKQELLDIYPHTLGAHFPYFKLDLEAFDNAIEVDTKDRERIKNKYTAYEVDDNLLGYFEDMGNYEKAGIIKIETIYETFGCYIDMLWRNEEIQKYFEFQGGAEDYKGFKYIQGKCLAFEKIIKNSGKPTSAH